MQLECLCFSQEEPPDGARGLRAHRTATLTFPGWYPELKGSGEPLGKYGENWTSVTPPPFLIVPEEYSELPEPLEGHPTP